MDRIASCYTYVSEGEPNPFPLGKCLPLVACVLQGYVKLTSITQTDVNKQVTLNSEPAPLLWAEAFARGSQVLINALQR